MNLADLCEEAKTLGYGINLGFRPDRTPNWSCALFAVYRSERYKGRGTYACKQGATLEEALASTLTEIKLPPREIVAPPKAISQLELDSILSELGDL